MLPLLKRAGFLMSADVIELQPRLEVDPDQEAYAHSLSTLRKFGAVTVKQVVDVEYKTSVQMLAFDDFATAEAEMLKTDKEHGETLEVNNVRIHTVIDGHVRARDGEPMVGILKNGASNSAAMAQKDERYKDQAERDACDVKICRRVDGLRPGETLWGISFAAQKALKKYPEIYDKKFGYKENLVYIQTYSMNDDTLTAGSFSIEVEDKAAFMELLAERGMEIPENESDNTWLKHSQTMEMNADEAKDFALSLRDEYYQRIDKSSQQKSVSEFIEANRDTLYAFFQAFYPDLSRAIYTGENNEIIQNFAYSVLQSGAQLKPEIRTQLVRITNSVRFTDEDGILMDSVIRYAVAEEMRKGLEPKPGQRADKSLRITQKDISTELQAGSMVALLAQNIKTGIEAGRSYGGCPGNIELGEGVGLKKGIDLSTNALPTDEIRSKLQEAFGGKEGKKTWEWKKGVCRIKTCKTRPGKTDVGPCEICKNCQEKFDKGQDPTKIKEEKQDEAPHQPNVISFESKKKEKHESAEQHESEPEPVSQPVAA